MSKNNDYEKYLHRNEKSVGELFSNMSKYWHGFMDEFHEDLKPMLDDKEYKNMAADAAEMSDDPEILELAADMSKLRLIAKASDKAICAIGKCLDGAAALFNKKQ